MRERIKFLISYYFYWVGFFIVTRALFLLYNWKSTRVLNASDIFSVFFYGLKLDFSFAGYICVFPFLVLTLLLFNPLKFQSVVVKFYTFLILFFIALLTVIDLPLYHAWGFRLDDTPLTYINTPKEMLASAGSSPIFSLAVLFILLFLIGGFAYLKFFQSQIEKFGRNSIIGVLVCLFLTAALFIPIRGSFGVAPINISAVYFSKNAFANHAAINVPWNFFFSALNKTKNDKNPYVYMGRSVAEDLVFKQNRTVDQVGFILKPGKINVIFLIWESFTAKASGVTGGIPGTTPGFDQLSKEGLLFTNCYSSGDRSEKGIVSILSAYPAQPTQSILKIPQKSEKLSSIPKVLSKENYNTGFYYGGEPEFANMKSYLVQNFDKMVTVADFPAKDKNSKWGAHDHIVLEKFLNDLDSVKSPFFYTLFTLSSHEPFEIPIAYKYSTREDDSLFLSSHYYTDQSISQFISKAKTKSWWDNTLIVILGDHGHALPGDSPAHVKEKFHIPMLWIGGAIDTTGIYSNYCNQTDLALTLLNQMGLKDSSMKFSRDLFNPEYRNNVYYTYNNGFGVIDRNGYFTFDHISKNTTFSEGKTDSLDLFGKAMSQVVFQDFIEK